MLKDLLARPQALLAPGVYDALSALSPRQAGFEALYLSVPRSPIRAWAAPTSA
jgi:2-methylisocitrate lyase-like PEP mutase family enzyme